MRAEERVTPSQIHHHSTSSSEPASCSPAMVCVYDGPQELWDPPSRDENTLWKLSKCCSVLSLCTLLLETELTTLPQHLQSCYYEKPRNKTHGRVCAGLPHILKKELEHLWIILPKVRCIGKYTFSINFLFLIKINILRCLKNAPLSKLRLILCHSLRTNFYY